MSCLAPESIYCLKCKEHVKPGEPELKDTAFKSKGGKDLTRPTWSAKCPKCGSRVSRFAKTDKVEKVEKVAEVAAPAAEKRKKDPKKVARNDVATQTDS
jgi:Zn finger protein HypA/HybF involved in hydrogenase expression